MGAGFWPSVLHFKGINRKEENNKNKRKATTTRQTIKTHEKYLNSIIIQQRNTKASETKQPKIETKQNKKRKTRGLRNKQRNATLSLFSKPQIFSPFKSLLSLS